MCPLRKFNGIVCLYKVFKLQFQQDGGTLLLLCKEAVSDVAKCMNITTFLGANAQPPFLLYSRAAFLSHPLTRLLHFVYYWAPSVLLLLTISLDTLGIWKKSFCVLVCVHSLSILIAAFTEPFPASPVLIHTEYALKEAL